MRDQTSSICLKILCLVVCTLWTATAIAAKTKADSKGKDAGGQKLGSNQQDEIDKLIGRIRKSGHPANVRAVAKRIRDGLPPKSLSQAIDALVAADNQFATRTLLEFSNHRSKTVRKKIAKNLPYMQTPKAMKRLRGFLDDHDDEVRSQAAIAIGKIGPTRAMNDLIEAARLGVAEAAEVVGKQMASRRTPRLIKMIDDENLLALAPVLHALIRRKDIADRHKLAVVTRLDEMSTPSSRGQLRLLVKGLPKWNVARLAALKALQKKREEKKPAEAKSKEKKPAEAKSKEKKPAEAKSKEKKPAEAKSKEKKPAQAKGKEKKKEEK